MSKNIDQIYTANPITSNASTDLMYFGQSPYAAGNDAAMTWGNFSAQFLQPANNLSDVASETSARNNLGLGTIATQNASLVAITGGSAALTTLTYGFKYVTVSGDIDLAHTQSNVLFVVGTSGLTISDDIGLSTFTQGFQFIIKNTSNGTIQFIPNTGDTIEGASSLMIQPNSAVLIGALATEWGILGSYLVGNTPGILGLSEGGTNADLTASAGSVVYSTSSAMAFSAAGTSGQLFQSAGTGAPGWTTSTYPSTNAINTLLYASSANVMAALATANDGVLVTSNTGVPSWLANSGTAGFVLTANTGAPPSWQAITAEGAVTSISGDTGSATPSSGVITISGGATGLTTSGTSHTLSLTGTLVLANGGTSASLVASNGGIFYSTGSAGAILAGTATAHQLLLSGASTTPLWSTSTYPTTNAVNTLLYASSANVMAALATANNSVLLTSSAGVPSLGGVGQGLAIATSILSVGGANNIAFNNGVGFQDSNGNALLTFDLTASAVNSIAIENAATGAGPSIVAAGTDTNVPLNISSKGTGSIGLLGENDSVLIANFAPVASGVNYFTFTAAATGNSPTLAFTGTDANVVGTVNGKGTGGVTIQGTTAASAGNAAAGYVGEVISSVIPVASQVSLSNITAANVTSINLTAGDWDVWGNVSVAISVAATAVAMWSSISSATLPDASLYNGFGATGTACQLNVPGTRVNVGSGGQTVYLSVYVAFSSGTAKACGGIYARRRR